MINTVELLLRGLVLHKSGHLLYVSAYQVRNFHHPYLGKMHRQPDVISIQAGESALTGEILHDEFHQRSILILEEPKRKHSLELSQKTRFDVWFIVLLVNFLPLIPCFSNVCYVGCQ